MDDSGRAGREGNQRVIYVNPVPAGRPIPREIDHTLNGYAITVLNELMHHAKAKGLYSDRVLAEAAFNVLTLEEQLEHPLPTSGGYEENSPYFHRLFNLKCAHPGE